MPIATQNAQAGPSRRRQERVQASQVEEEDDVEVQKPAVTEEEGWTIETFTDVPITKSDPILTFVSVPRQFQQEMILTPAQRSCREV